MRLGVVVSVALAALLALVACSDEPEPAPEVPAPQIPAGGLNYLGAGYTAATPADWVRFTRLDPASEDELEQIFDRLYRSRSEHVLAIPGGGLGLTIARTIVQRHGGDLWATSNMGEGSVFTFVLPTTSEI